MSRRVASKETQFFLHSLRSRKSRLPEALHQERRDESGTMEATIRTRQFSLAPSSMR